MVFLSFFRQILGLYFHYGTTVQFEILSNSVFVVIRPTIPLSIVKQTTNNRRGDWIILIGNAGETNASAAAEQRNDVTRTKDLTGRMCRELCGRACARLYVAAI
jgi:hypothetical protein